MPHVLALDGLRGLAILAVVAYHAGILRGGFVGVDLFFALSGFLITRLLMIERDRHGDVRLDLFWARRARRLVPALVVAIVLAIGVSQAVGMPLETLWIVATLCYASNVLIGWFHVYPLGVLSHGWSLALEEQFYLLWPPLLVVVSRFGSRALIAAAAVLAIVPALLRLAYRAAHPGDPYTDPTLWLRLYFAPEMRFDAIALGCLGAVLSGRLLSNQPAIASAASGERRRIAALAAVGAVSGLGWLAFMAVTADIGTFVGEPLLFSLTSLAAIALVLGAQLAPSLARVLGWGPLVALGRISYGLYLYHAILFFALDRSPVALRVAVAVALATVSYWTLERPILGLNRRYARA